MGQQQMTVRVSIRPAPTSDAKLWCGQSTVTSSASGDLVRVATTGHASHTITDTPGSCRARDSGCEVDGPEDEHPEAWRCCELFSTRSSSIPPQVRPTVNASLSLLTAVALARTELVGLFPDSGNYYPEEPFHRYGPRVRSNHEPILRRSRWLPK